jgi:mRNA interferase YafQ
MLKISRSNQYKRSIKKYKNDARFLVELGVVIEYLAMGKVLPHKYRDHELKGKFKGMRECHIRPDDLLLYFVVENEVLKLVDIGSHSKIFKM